MASRQNRRLTRDARYGKYEGGPDPLAPPVDLTEALDAIGEDVMGGTSPERALREFLRRGGQTQRGLDDLMRRVAERRRELTSRNNLDGTLQQVRSSWTRPCSPSAVSSPGTSTSTTATAPWPSCSSTACRRRPRAPCRS